MMALNLNQAQHMAATGDDAIIFYAWDLANHMDPLPSTMKYVLIEELVNGTSKYACACGFKLVKYSNVDGAYIPGGGFPTPPFTPAAVGGK
jgi:hypothetical protein